MFYEKLSAAFSIILVYIMCLFPLMLTASKASSAEYEKIKPLSQTCGKLIITVDPRLELLAVIQYLAGSDMVQTDSEGYAASVEEWFADLRNHPVLGSYRALEAKGYSYDLPVSCFLRFDGVPLGIQVRTWETYMVSMNQERMRFVAEGGSVEDFYGDVRDFAIKGDFEGFFASQSDFLSAKISSVASFLSQKPDMIAHMVNWYGYSRDSYTLALSPLLVQNCYGPALVDMKGKTTVYCVMGLDTKELTEDTLYYLARIFFHEISHSYVNSLVDAHYDQFALAQVLHEPISKKMETHAYKTWWITVAEHFVRASEIRLLQLYFPLGEHNNLMNSQINLGFIYIDNIYSGLLEYEQAKRETGIRYDGYFPHLVKNFVKLADDPEVATRSRLGFKGPLNSVAIAPVVVIYPDPQRVEGVGEYIGPTVAFLIQRLNADAYTDTEALNMDLKDKNVYVYGALGTNLWLENYLHLLPFKILPDRLIADKEYAGSNLRIAACLPHPQNPELGMAVYTAQTTVGMKESNSFFHGPEDWYVTDTNKNVLGKGNFTDKNEIWKF